MITFRRASVSVALTWVVACLAVGVTAGSASADTCANAQVREEQGSARLPDCRAYEMVSPVQKYGGVPVFPLMRGNLSEAAIAASADGSRMVWPSATPFADASNGLFLGYLSTRTALGWETRQQFPDPVDPHPNYLLSVASLVDVTDDLVTKITTTTQPHDPLAVTNPFFRADLYRQDGDELAPTWVTRPEGDGPATSAFARATYQGRTPDGSHIVFRTDEALDPAAAGQVDKALYERADGHTRLVSVDSSGQPVGNCGAYLGGGYAQQTQGAISDDGARIFFSEPAMFGFGDPSCDEPTGLYLRAGGQTVKVSAAQRPVNGPDPGGAKPALFEGASSDGSVVYFSSAEALTDDAQPATGSAKSLYAYDVADGTLRLLTPPTPVRFQTVVGMSKDGSRLYVVAYDPLVNGTGASSAHNLYVYDGGAFHFITTLDETFLSGASGGAADTWDVTAYNRAGSIRVSDDGKQFVFPSRDNLTSFDSHGKVELYLFDVDRPADGGLRCISCRTDGEAPVGDAHLWHGESINSFTIRDQLPRTFGANGEIFFDSDDALVSEDDNGVTDAYMWRDGVVSLISTGRERRPSFFIDSARGGQDAFFVTSQPLVGWDRDASADIYVARVGGGFPEPPKDPAPCGGDACQGEVVAGPAAPVIGSVTFTGFGDAVPRLPATPASGAVAVAVSAVAVVKGSAAALKVRVPGAGAIVISGASTRRATRAATRAATYSLRVALTSKAALTLKAKRKLKVKVKVSFAAHAGKTASKTVTLTFEQPRRATATKRSRS
jgi:hypothetical protein